MINLFHNSIHAFLFFFCGLRVSKQKNNSTKQNVIRCIWKKERDRESSPSAWVSNKGVMVVAVDGEGRESKLAQQNSPRSCSYN